MSSSATSLYAGNCKSDMFHLPLPFYFRVRDLDLIIVVTVHAETDAIYSMETSSCFIMTKEEKVRYEKHMTAIKNDVECYSNHLSILIEQELTKNLSENPALVNNFPRVITMSTSYVEEAKIPWE